VTIRVALYARYSSDRQNERSIEDQFEVCRRHAIARGWTVTATFQDAAISGAAMANRPGINAMLALAEAGVVDTILVEDEDRLARNQEHAHHIKSRLDFAGVAIATLTTDQVDDIGMTFKGLMGAMYLKNLSAKTKRGMSSNFEHGLSTGGRIYGYRSQPGGQLKIEPEEAEVVRRIFRLYAAGFPGRDIAELLNRDAVAAVRGGPWSASTINGNASRQNGILHNQLYVGVRFYNRVEKRTDPRTGRHVDRVRPQEEWLRRDVPQLRIVQQADWEAAVTRRQTFAGKNGTGKGRPPRAAVGLFSGLFKCGICSSSYTAKGSGRLQCAGFANRGPSFCSNRRSVARRAVEQRVLEGLRTRLLRPEAVLAYVRAFHEAWAIQRAQDTSRELVLEKKVAEIRRRLARLIEAIEIGASTPDTIDRIKQLAGEREAAEVDLIKIRAEAPPAELHPGAIEIYRRTIEDLQARLTDRDDSAEGRSLITTARGLIEKVEIVPTGDDNGDPVDLILHGKLAPYLKPPTTDAGRQPWGGMVVAGGGIEPPTCGL
jgi:site-specific DNA recombinase